MLPPLKIVRLAKDLPLPSYQTAGAAGMDLYSDADGVLYPGMRDLIPCGFSLEIPPGYEGQVRGRSGLRIKHGIVVPVGTIDSDYRGPMGVVLFNLGSEPFRFQRGDRIAQLIISPVVQVSFVEVDELAKTDRGAGGYGSTGRK
jgi:dUTP pyrophosphatase